MQLEIRNMMHSASRIPPTIQSFVVPFIDFDNNCVEHVGCYTSADILNYTILSSYKRSIFLSIVYLIYLLVFIKIQSEELTDRKVHV